MNPFDLWNSWLRGWLQATHQFADAQQQFLRQMTAVAPDSSQPSQAQTDRQPRAQREPQPPSGRAVNFPPRGEHKIMAHPSPANISASPGNSGTATMPPTARAAFGQLKNRKDS